MTAVHPRCALGIHVGPYISAQGYHFPCCWIANEPHLASLRQFLGDDYASMDINSGTLEDVRKAAGWQRIRDSWEQGTLKPCVFFCGQPFQEDDPKMRDRNVSFDLSTLEVDSW